MIKHKKYTHTVPSDFLDNRRLRTYLLGIFPYLETGSAIKKAIQKNQIFLNEKQGYTGDWVSSGDVIVFDWKYEVSEEIIQDINIMYEDQDLMVVIKPPGLSSSGNTRSLQSQLKSITPSEEDGMLPFPFLVHRLDKATEGLMIAAKTMKVRRALSDMMEGRSIIKHYVLIIAGHLSQDIKTIETDIDGQVSKTEIIKIVHLDTKDPTTRVFVKLHTGRTHQIRRHFADIKHPIIGDQLYNESGLTFGTGLLLCAYYLEFRHPETTKIIKVEYPIPLKINKYKPLY